MELARNVERRLERLVEGLAGRVFRGPLHPVELGALLVRQADLAVVERPYWPQAPNIYSIHVHPETLQPDDLPPGLEGELAAVIESSASDRGWRLEGPVRVAIQLDESVSVASVECRTDLVPGPRAPWALLEGVTINAQIRHNRVTLGRAPDCTVVVASPKASRHHALLWREGGKVWIDDLKSRNGTTVDGAPVRRPVIVPEGALISVGPVNFTLRMV